MINKVTKHELFFFLFNALVLALDECMLTRVVLLHSKNICFIIVRGFFFPKKQKMSELGF